MSSELQSSSAHCGETPSRQSPRASAAQGATRWSSFKRCRTSAVDGRLTWWCSSSKFKRKMVLRLTAGKKKRRQHNIFNHRQFIVNSSSIRNIPKYHWPVDCWPSHLWEGFCCSTGKPCTKTANPCRSCRIPIRYSPWCTTETAAVISDEYIVCDGFTFGEHNFVLTLRNWVSTSWLLQLPWVFNLLLLIRYSIIFVWRRIYTNTYTVHICSSRTVLCWASCLFSAMAGWNYWLRCTGSRAENWSTAQIELFACDFLHVQLFIHDELSKTVRTCPIKWGLHAMVGSASKMVKGRNFGWRISALGSVHRSRKFQPAMAEKNELAHACFDRARV